MHNSLLLTKLSNRTLSMVCALSAISKRYGEVPMYFTNEKGVLCIRVRVERSPSSTTTTSHFFPFQSSSPRPTLSPSISSSHQPPPPTPLPPTNIPPLPFPLPPTAPKPPTMPPPTPSPYVTLISSDGFEFIVSRDAAYVAGTIRKMLDPTSNFAEAASGRCFFETIKCVFFPLHTQW